ncbi:hypothetical protein ACIO8H_28140 [Streptomyces sp. NPDC087226]|uniref:hypothetical protein n=1 Tax=Streptomyces sp. NPDC087226 TaxID=3365771 RepID=UPI0038256CCD
MPTDVRGTAIEQSITVTLEHMEATYSTFASATEEPNRNREHYRPDRMRLLHSRALTDLRSRLPRPTAGA